MATASWSTTTLNAGELLVASRRTVWTGCDEHPKGVSLPG